MHLIRAHIDPEKVKFCFSLEQRRKCLLRAVHSKWKATKGSVLCVILKTLNKGTGAKVVRNNGQCPEEGH